MNLDSFSYISKSKSAVRLQTFEPIFIGVKDIMKKNLIFYLGKGGGGCFGYMFCSILFVWFFGGFFFFVF